ncbi:MAG: acyl-CoA dehydrogenase family protein [Candidatus Eremiobacteraeota bacterium]|nr:acyl-CoA dehydrogenase family protein [Candidatus Eremiobacteraeota bacterium]
MATLKTDAARNDVTNQPPPLVGYNVFEGDRALAAAVEREGASFAAARLRGIGAEAGSEEAIAAGFAANERPPALRSHDRFGNRIDEVEFDPRWHWLMQKATSFGLHCSPWREERSGAHVARAAAFYVWSQVEAGHGCPISMTYAAIPVLRAHRHVGAEWAERMGALDYDPALKSFSEKRSGLCGMGMTEKQGGSDVRANTTQAVPEDHSGSGEPYLLTGHKWFCSAPMCDAFLVLAQAPRGLSCFLLPRILPDETRNVFAIQRLKDKLGNRSNASCEVEFKDTVGFLIGEEGRGVQTIIEMVNFTRLDCVNGSAALMRQALVQALHHARYRYAFGRALIDQPLMKNVLADLALESEAALALLMRVARAADRAASDEREAAIKRIGTAIAKYWVCKRAPMVVAEALECLGGNGYVEESVMPRLYREAPLNSIWEGSGNVNALDVLRAMQKTPDALEAMFGEMVGAGDVAIVGALHRLRQEASDAEAVELRARRIVEELALTWQAALLQRTSIAPVADAFARSRLTGDGGRALGTLPASVDFDAIVQRAFAG